MLERKMKMMTLGLSNIHKQFKRRHGLKYSHFKYHLVNIEEYLYIASSKLGHSFAAWKWPNSLWADESE